MIRTGFDTRGRLINTTRKKIGAGIRISKRGRTIEGDDRSALSKHSYTNLNVMRQT